MIIVVSLPSEGREEKRENKMQIRKYQEVAKESILTLDVQKDNEGYKICYRIFSFAVS